MATKWLVFYLLSGFSMAVFPLFIITHYQENHQQLGKKFLVSSLHSTLSETQKVWPKLEFGWRIVVATIIGFLGSAFGTVGGVGGGGIFVPMLTLIVGFDTKSAAALSKCMIMAASASSVWYNLRVQHPCRDVPILDYDLALLFQPMLMLGITLGVALSVVFPYWLITVLIIILFLGTSSRSFSRGIMMWKEETILNTELTKQQNTFVNSRGELLIDTEYEPLCPKEEKSAMQIMSFNLNWKRLLLLVIVWVSFVLLQVLKNDVAACTTWYWVLNLIQFPVAFGVFGYEAVKLYEEGRKRKITGNTQSVCEASIEFTPITLSFCALCGLLGGTVGGLLGSGGGFILGPLLLEIGVIPQVASATATFVMLFSSSLSVVEFYFLKRFPITYALYLMSVSLLAGFWGQYLVRKMVVFLKRASLIVFILSAVIFASALTMGVIGIEKTVHMINNHEFVGFLDFCSNQ
ncbi:sulfite exporter TauE/SafE family protein 4-like [Amaranthus tricolor]|uniref:sulfite exporter TauE/SafE family protein 4-like n=1 Tax=Amaranthus tricolor TaxID=29722 RepID=UPI00258B83E9|nr:sulfite exporter TauE/SafE family protein 4-like [Amaranthus tricolor]